MYMKKSTVAAGVAGLAAGAALGVLFAPKSGKETREDLMKALDNLSNKVKALKPEDVKKYVDKNIKKIKKELDELSMEKVLKAAKKKANQVQDSIESLANYVKEKGTPVLEGMANDLREKVISAAQEVIDKLEEK